MPREAHAAEDARREARLERQARKAARRVLRRARREITVTLKEEDENGRTD
jgi:hypothetical protein